MNTPLVPRNTNYDTLLCYQKARVVYDLTYHFCERFIDKRDRTHDQMIQAARSGKQNIVEGYTDKATSYKMALKLFNVARGSLQELQEDYKDYLRSNNLTLWEQGSEKELYMRNLGRTHSDSEFFINIAESRNAETIANMAIILITQADSLTYKYIEYMGREFEDNGGFSEKLTRIRIEKRNK